VQDDCIAVRLELPQLEILEQRELGNYFEIAVKYRREETECPRCGRVTNKIQDRRLQWKQDRKLRDKLVLLKLVKRRFRCLMCGKTFSEPDEIFGVRRRSTKRFREYLGQEALHQTIRRLARQEGVGEGLVRRCVTEDITKALIDENEMGTPEVLGVDEFAVKKRHYYHTTICDIKGKKIMAVVEGKGKHNLEKYLSKLPEPDKVKAVAMDMHEPFRQAVQMSLPGAAIVVDKFHLISHVNQALDKTRSRQQGGREKAGKKRNLFENRYTLLTASENLKEEERTRLREIFHSYPEVKEVWLLKEGFRNWYHSGNRQEAELRLRHFEEVIYRGSFSEFKKLMLTIKEWRNEILNYFDYRVTNGFVEGKNNRIKVIKRLAYGYRNMENFKLRILATNQV